MPGQVRLIARAAVWYQSTATGWKEFLLFASAHVTGLLPLARALERPRMSRWINITGAIVALPTYVILPALVAL
jgi:hypothetical protein